MPTRRELNLAISLKDAGRFRVNVFRQRGEVAMVVLDEQLRSAGHRSEMLLQIHDELVIEVPVEHLENVAQVTREVMEGVVELGVPLRVDVASGRTLAECKS